MEVTFPDVTWLHPHFHVLVFFPPGYFGEGSAHYIPQAEFRDMWRKAMRLDYDPVVDGRRLTSIQEVCKYVAKPRDFLHKLSDGSYWCDSDKLEVLHDGLEGRQMVVWSRNLSPIRKRLGLLKSADELEDLVHVGDDDDEAYRAPVAEEQYRWMRGPDGRWGYRLVQVRSLVSEDPDPDGDDFDFEPGGDGDAAWVN